MKYFKHFSIPVWSVKSPLKYNFDLAVKKCLELGNSEIQLDDYLEFKEIKSQLDEKIKTVCSDIHKDFKLKLMSTLIYINRNDNGNLNINFNTEMTGIHYLKCSEHSGKTVFVPTLLIDNCKNFNPLMSELFETTHEYIPSVGKMNIFPSWLPYTVNGSPPEDLTITMIFNFKQIYENSNLL